MRRGAAVAACVLMLVSGCAHPRPRSAAAILISPGDASRAVRPDAPVTVTVRDGRLRSVTLTQDGRRLDGVTNAAGTQWWPKWALAPGRSYRITATASGTDGRVSTVRSGFRTRRVAHTVAATVVD